MSNAPRLLVFASGTKEGGGSGFAKLVQASRSDELNADIVGVVSNHANGGVRQKAEKLGIPFKHFPAPWTADEYQTIAAESDADYFALSGWLKLVTGLDKATNFNSRTIFNIHPGPLPKFGGQGMHGHHVHQAVWEAYQGGEITHSAVTMHFVTDDAQYDVGPTVFRCEVPITDSDTPDSIGQKVNEQEHYFQSWVTGLIVNGLIAWNGQDYDSLTVPTGYSIDNQPFGAKPTFRLP